MSDYYTHREFLRKELDKLDYTNKVLCIEFGTGHGSGLLFSEYAEKYDNLKIISYETDSEWLEITREKYQKNNYIFNSVNSWDELLVDKNFQEVYDLVFVDQSPWEARIKSIDLIKNKSKVIVLHDYDFYNKGVCDDIYSVTEGSFFYEKYSNDFDFSPHYTLLPPTLIMKNKNIN